MAPSTKNAAQIVVAIALALLSLVVSAYSGYTHDDKKTGERITAVETQQLNDGRRLERIEDKVDKVLDVVATRR